ncbi:uncharacterized protein LOC134848798 [Symsagittifera roscoffensis]|uniref:uncharacterized protein LOC134848798 n=1 Tax=Symsagittifera roscoffensis TaxID=84072 RepID=UPI00307C7FFC
MISLHNIGNLIESVAPCLVAFQDNSYDAAGNWFDYYASRDDTNMPRRPDHVITRTRNDSRHNDDRSDSSSSLSPLPPIDYNPFPSIMHRRKSNERIRDLRSASDDADASLHNYSLRRDSHSHRKRSRASEKRRRSREDYPSGEDRRQYSGGGYDISRCRRREKKQVVPVELTNRETDSGFMTCDADVRKRVSEWQRRNERYKRSTLLACGTNRERLSVSPVSSESESEVSLYKHDGLPRGDPKHVPRAGSYFEHDDRSFRRYKLRKRYRSPYPQRQRRDGWNTNRRWHHYNRMSPSTHYRRSNFWDPYPHPKNQFHNSNNKRRYNNYQYPNYNYHHESRYPIRAIQGSRDMAMGRGGWGMYSGRPKRRREVFRPTHRNNGGVVIRMKRRRQRQRVPRRYMQRYDNHYEKWMHDKYDSYESISSDSLSESEDDQEEDYDDSGEDNEHEGAFGGQLAKRRLRSQWAEQRGTSEHPSFQYQDRRNIEGEEFEEEEG